MSAHIVGSRPTDPQPKAEPEAETPARRYRRDRQAHWNRVARLWGARPGAGRFYHQRLSQLYRHLVPPGQRVLELGCGQGDLLASLKPSIGIGVDFSEEMIRLATARHPDLRFIVADAHDFRHDERFDVIILSDLVNDLWDVQLVVERAISLATPRSRIILNTYSRLWEPVLLLAQRIGLSKPTLHQNWLTVEDLDGLLTLADAETIRSSAEILCPLQLPLLASIANQYLVKLWPFRLLALTNVMVARRRPQPEVSRPLVSVIIPARNEAGNIPRIVDEVPEMGAGTELVFVEGHSRDETYTAIERAIASRSDRRCRLVRQTGEGKGDAVRLGFAEARGDLLMILDADLTVPPLELPRFYHALRSGQAEFANGVRLVYPMERQAMRFFNLVGNKFFSQAFSWLLGQPIKDTLCGTKVLWRIDYERIVANRAYFGDFDPFGDFDLLFGAARLNLKILDVPIRYGKRTYGQTNIQRWQHGWLLLRMVMHAARRIKFR